MQLRVERFCRVFSIFLSCVSALLLSSLSPSTALATCRFDNGPASELHKNVQFNIVSVQRDSPIGTVLATAVTGSYNEGIEFFGCGSAWVYRWSNTLFTTVSSYGDNVYDTNIEGVGLRLTNTGNNSAIPFSRPQSAGQFAFLNNNGIQAELIKTKSGAIGAGVLTSGILARGSIVGQFNVANITLTGTNTIIPVACSVSNNAIIVPMGNVSIAEFSGVGSTAASGKKFDIPLDCDADTKVNLTLDGRQDSSGAVGVLALDSSSENVATGVGLQLLYNGTPVNFGMPITVGAVASDSAYSISLVARYYQTGVTVSAGQASSTATFTMTYD